MAISPSNEKGGGPFGPGGAWVSLEELYVAEMGPDRLRRYLEQPPSEPPVYEELRLFDPSEIPRVRRRSRAQLYAEGRSDGS